MDCRVRQPHFHSSRIIFVADPHPVLMGCGRYGNQSFSPPPPPYSCGLQALTISVTNMRLSRGCCMDVGFISVVDVTELDGHWLGSILEVMEVCLVMVT